MFRPRGSLRCFGGVPAILPRSAEAAAGRSAPSVWAPGGSGRAFGLPHREGRPPGELEAAVPRSAASLRGRRWFRAGRAGTWLVRGEAPGSGAGEALDVPGREGALCLVPRLREGQERSAAERYLWRHVARVVTWFRRELVTEPPKTSVLRRCETSPRGFVLRKRLSGWRGRRSWEGIPSGLLRRRKRYVSRC